MTSTPSKLARSLLFALVVSVAATAGAVEPPRVIDSYVLFAYDEMILKGATGASPRGHIRGGDIGVNYPTANPNAFALSYATFGRVIMDPGSQAVADSVRCSSVEGVFFDLFANRVNASFAATIDGAGPLPFTPPIIAPADLPAFPFTPGRALTDGAADVTVGGTGLPSPFTFAPGAYRDVRLNNDAVVTFGDGTFDLRSLEIGRDVTINVTDQTILRIDGGMSINDGLRLGLGTHSGAQIFLGALGFNPTATPVVNFAHYAEIHVQLFAPNGWLDLGGRNQLFGRYIARRISGDPNNNVTLEFPPLQPPGGGLIDPFQCYEIHRAPLDRTVTLTDALGPSTAVVERAKRICAPADVNGADPTAPSHPGHLTYYTIERTSPFPKVKNVDVTNPFGTVTVDLARPDRLLVPTSKSVTAPPAPLAAPLDHFTCYRVSGAQARIDDLAITDQFGTITIDVKRPLHLCLAADKNGEGVPTPDAAMLCYQVRGVPPDTAPDLVYTNNQFGADQYPFFGPRDLCVPSTVVLP
ncbi:MAG: hypothetical protein IT294_05480 [Deltaproteobacteria bacterium]|nr:hypothetical protein [Deltaproteobacteria bacterium]